MGLDVLELVLAIEDSFPMLEALSTMTLSPARVDFGKLTIAWQKQGRPQPIRDFLARELAEIVDQPEQIRQPKDVVLYGFGRIGRLLARLLIERTGGGSVMRLRGLVRKEFLQIVRDPSSIMIAGPR